MVDGARVFLLRTTMRENRALHNCLLSNVGATRGMIHSDLASGDPKNRPEATVRWLSVAQYKVLGPRSKASRSPLLQTAHVRVFSRLPEHSPAVRLKHPFPINNRHGRSRSFCLGFCRRTLVENCLRFEQGRAQTTVSEKESVLGLPGAASDLSLVYAQTYYKHLKQVDN